LDDMYKKIAYWLNDAGEKQWQLVVYKTKCNWAQEASEVIVRIDPEGVHESF
jgi:hypothetical protein